jgi:MraZ protein
MVSLNPASHRFAGEFRHSLDGKNRVTIPSQWRQGETDTFYLLPSPSPKLSVTVMPEEGYARFSEEAKSQLSPDKYRVFLSFLYSKVQIISTDKAGRLLIPETFRSKVGLQQETVLTGGGDRFEIWNPENWDHFQQANEAAFEEIARSVGL